MLPLSIPCFLFLIHALLAGQSIATLFPPSNETTLIAALHACTELKSVLGSSIVQSFGAEYQAAASNAWNLQNAEYQPTCIVFPAMKGWNSVQAGVLIMFSHMQKASYDPEKDTIELEPGIRWRDAVVALEPYSVAPVGGRVGDVGTGFLLGGGLSWLSPSKGYAADNFKELDIVLVNGDMVTVTATNQHSDLLRALKGGGNRFGIVTRYELYPAHTGTKDTKPFFGGSMIFNSSDALLRATAKYVREVDDPKAVLLVTVVLIVQDKEITPFYGAFMFYNGTELPANIFGDFLSIPAISSKLGPASYLDVTATLGLENERGYVQHFGASALVGEEDLFLDAFEHLKNFTMAFKDQFNVTSLAFTPIPDSQIQAGHAKGRNIINAPRGGFSAVQIMQTLKSGVRDITSDLQRGIDLLFEQIPPSPGLPLFLNECDLYQNVYQSYGDYNLLKEIYAKYDPTRFNVQHTQGPIGL
ncbi:FAD-binding protein [Mycena venus]|uniref:FAD-binding protein n=1 Tax=Mycena venus TaxID=2733690 RepID=A0A8H6Y4B0_9AGAR|nr:FAD-binding protein [Mycena venus]